MSFEVFSSYYDQEEICVRALFEMRWPDGFRCPRCQHHSAYVITTRRLPLYECQVCRAQTSLIVGTVMEGSRTLLSKWFQAIYLHARPGGVNAIQLAQIIGVTYKTAWLICHKLRYAMTQTDSEELLSGLVHITEAVYARRYVPHFSWHPQEQPLLIGGLEDDSGTIVKIKIEQQKKENIKERCTPIPIDRFVKRYVDRKAAARAALTRGLNRNVNLTLKKMALEAQLWLACLFRGIGSKHLQTYLNHYCYIFNRDKDTLLKSLFHSCVKSRTITYPQLVGRTAGMGMAYYKLAS